MENAEQFVVCRDTQMVQMWSMKCDATFHPKNKVVDRTESDGAMKLIVANPLVGYITCGTPLGSLFLQTLELWL